MILKKYQQQPGQANLVKNQAEIMLSKIFDCCVAIFTLTPVIKCFFFRHLAHWTFCPLYTVGRADQGNESVLKNSFVFEKVKVFKARSLIQT